MGGFIEDLPVMALVLCGVATIIASSVWSSDRIADGQLEEELRGIAQQFADRLVEAALTAEGTEHPSICRISELNVSRLAADLPEGVGYAASFVQVYPTIEWILQESSCEMPVPERACGASRLLNALDESFRAVIVEVRVVAW